MWKSKTFRKTWVGQISPAYLAHLEELSIWTWFISQTQIVRRILVRVLLSEYTIAMFIAFLRYDNEDSVRKAIDEMHGQTIKKKELSVSKCSFDVSWHVYDSLARFYTRLILLISSKWVLTLSVYRHKFSIIWAPFFRKTWNWWEPRKRAAWVEASSIKWCHQIMLLPFYFSGLCLHKSALNKLPTRKLRNWELFKSLPVLIVMNA